MASRASMATMKPKEADDDLNQNTIRLEIGMDWCIQAPAKSAKKRMPIPGANALNEPPGLYQEDGLWLITNPAHMNTYSKYRAPAHGPLLTRGTAVGEGWDMAPMPIPVQSGDTVDLRLRVYGGDMPEMPTLSLKEQTFELPDGRDGVVKHMLGGRVSVRIIRRGWQGPFVAIMSPETRAQYVKAFRQYDLDGGGTIDSGELAEAFKGFGLDFTPPEITEIMKRYNELGDFEVTFDEFCEMMEAELNDHKAWFVSAVRVTVPKGGFEMLLMDSEGADDHGLYRRLQPVFDELDTGDRGVINTVELGNIFLKLGYRVPPDSVTKTIEDMKRDGKTMLTFDEVFEILNAPGLKTQLRAQVLAQTRESKDKINRLRIEAKARAVLYHLSGTDVKVRTTRVGCSHRSLNSGDAFLLDGHYMIFLWVGKEANESEIEKGTHAMKQLVFQRRGINVREQIVEEGSEPADFWYILGGQGPIADSNTAMADEIAEGMRDPISPLPSPRTTPPNCAVVGGGIAGAACAKQLSELFCIEVVVFESKEIVGGRMCNLTKSGVQFSAGATYFSASGPHIRPMLQDLIQSAAIHEWKPRVGVVTKASEGSDTTHGFIAPMHTIEEEVNVEAWIEARPQTGAKRHPKASHRPATAFHDPVKNVPIYELPPPDIEHRRSNALYPAQGHGSASWYICRPDMSFLVRHLLRSIDVKTNACVQAVLPKLGTGQYEIVYEDLANRKLVSAGLFDFVLFCMPPEESARLLMDCQPRLAYIPRLIKSDPIWVVLLAFDHPIFTPFDVLYVEDAASPPLAACFRESTRYSSNDPFQNATRNTQPVREWLPPREAGRMWGGGDPITFPRVAPSTTVYGSPVDSWALHLTPEWSREHRGDFAEQVTEVAMRAFMKLIGMPNSQVRAVVSEAVLWANGRVLEPASVFAMSPNADPALGPYCLFDPSTGIGCAGDWCVESSVEGAFVSGMELAARVGKSPIMFNEGQSNPYGPVQFEAEKQQRMRVKRELHGMEVMSGYSSDSRPSVMGDGEFGNLDWEDHARFQYLIEQHKKHTDDVDGVVRKTRRCRNEGCGRMVLVTEEELHARVCPYRPSVRCPYTECVTYCDPGEIEVHKLRCEFRQTRECDWCFKQIPMPEAREHMRNCIGRPKTSDSAWSQ